MTTLSYELIEIEPTRIGFVVLQSDETLERDMFHMKGDADLFFSRVPNAATVNADTLQAMAAHMTTSASLFPETNTIDAIGYGCTSGTAQIGADNVARLIKDGTQVRQVSEPVSALIAACKHLGLRKIAFLSPYVEQVSENLRRVLRDNDVQSPQFGTFAEEADAKVVRIAPQSIIDAARHLTLGHDVDGLFMSCTSLRTMDLIEPLETDLGVPVLSSNLVLAWHLAQLSGNPQAMSGPGRLFNG